MTKTVPGTRPAVVTIDLHRGHLDPTVATMPLPADAAARVVANNARFLARARAAGLPVIHVVTRYRSSSEALANPFWASVAATDASRSSVESHQVEPTPCTELMPGIVEVDDVVIDTKKRYDCFLGTDLGFVLAVEDVDTILLTGVNTNSCVLTTTIVASTRDYAPVVVSDCVASMDGPEFHDAALRCIALAFGWVIHSSDVFAAVGVSAGDVPAR